MVNVRVQSGGGAMPGCFFISMQVVYTISVQKRDEKMKPDPLIFRIQ